ncbi:MAG: hypothetical protein ACKVJU_13005 [Verrucomicrobiales bacterium]
MAIGTIDGLLTKLRPTVLCPTEEDWITIDRKISLPNDYKSFVSQFGAGQIDFFISIMSPLGDLLTANGQLNKTRAELRTKFPEIFDFNLYPEKGGAFQFGSTDNGDPLVWETNEDPDGWTVGIIPSRRNELERFQCGFEEFLVSLLDRRIEPDCFPQDFLDNEHTYH